MEIIKSILLMLSILFSISSYMAIKEAFKTGRNNARFSIILTCILWGVFYYLNQI